MTRSYLLAAALWLAICVVCSAQASQYGAWDQFFYKVQTPVSAATPSAEVTLLVYHSYPGSLHDVRATASSDVFEVTQQPKALGTLDPTEIRRLTFAVRAPRGTTQDRATLHVALRARELPAGKSLAVIVPLTAQAADDVNEKMRLPVGTMEVRVGGFGNQMYLLYLVPMLALIGWMLWRRKRLAAL